MKKITVTLAALAMLALTCGAAMAHDMWGTADNPTAGQILKAVIGYGHNFPTPEAIPDEELPFFKVSVLSPKGSLKLTGGQPNYVFNSTENVQKGTYLVLANVDPIFWTKTPTGWSMKPKNETAGGLNCGNFIESAKGVVNVAGDTAVDLVAKPVGLPIEIVPQANPAAVKPGQKLTLKVLLNGKPLAGAVVNGRYGEYASLASPTALAFTDTTNQDGDVTFVPLAAGDWLITTTSEEPFPEPARCDTTNYGTSLFMVIK